MEKKLQLPALRVVLICLNEVRIYLAKKTATGTTSILRVSVKCNKFRLYKIFTIAYFHFLGTADCSLLTDERAKAFFFFFHKLIAS
jgi:hypothetical protein